MFEFTGSLGGPERLTTEKASTAMESLTRHEPIVEYLLSKILAKLEDFEQFVVEATTDDGTNIRKDFKKLGIFLVVERDVTTEMREVLKENNIQVGEKVLELHIPPQENDLKFVDFNESKKRLIEYLDANVSDRGFPEYVYGISYFAGMAKRWGFNVVNIPDELKEASGAYDLLERYGESDNPKYRRMANKFNQRDIKLCYVRIEDWLNER